MKRLVSIFILMGLFGCAGLNYSQISPDAGDFHPKTIAILPATVGGYEAARDVVDTVVSDNLAKSGWYDKVADTAAIKTQITNSAELAKDIEGYMHKLNTIGISDPSLSSKIRNALQADALVLTYVTSWGYGRMEGNKIARIGLGIRLVDASKGTIIWKANHELIKDYWFVKPDLNKVANELMGIFLKEMPH